MYNVGLSSVASNPVLLLQFYFKCLQKVGNVLLLPYLNFCVTHKFSSQSSGLRKGVGFTGRDWRSFVVATASPFG